MSAENETPAIPNDSQAAIADFMKEQIKQRPVNRKRLFKRTLVTVALAVIFGGVASLSFILLEPVLTNILYPAQEPEQVLLTEEIEEEEILPEEMVADDRQMVSEAAEAVLEAAQQADQQDLDQAVRDALLEKTDRISDLQETGKSLKELAAELKKTAVTVSRITSNVNWFNDSYQNTGLSEGLIIAETEEELLILSMKGSQEDDQILITFADGTQAEGAVRGEDPALNFQVIEVNKKTAGIENGKSYEIAVFGNSDVSGSELEPVMIISTAGSISNIVNCGLITGRGESSGIIDTACKLIYTDVYGSTGSTGIVYSLSGKVLGILDMNQRNSAMSGMLTALGITQLKPVIQLLSNGGHPAHLGICGTVPEEAAAEASGMPQGVYVTEVEMDSAAMNAGIQTGDIITRLGTKEIHSYKELTDWLYTVTEDTQIPVTICRSSAGGYTEMNLSLEIMIE